MSIDLDKFPCQLNGVEEYNLGQEMLLYIPDKAIGVSLNSSSKTIWELCNGQYNAAEISQEIAKSLRISDDNKLFNVLLSDVLAALNQLHNLGVIELKKLPTTKLA